MSPTVDRLSAWRRARHVLCVRLDTLGDVLMTGPALRALRADRHRRITLLTSSAGAEVAGLMPEIDDVIAYDAPWMKATAPRSDSRPDRSMADRLRDMDLDAAVIFTVYSQNPLPSAFLCYLADIRLRLAYSREKAYQLLTDRVPEPEPDRFIRHEVKRQLDLVAAVGFRSPDEALRLPVSEASRRSITAALHAHTAGRPWVVVHPGASAPSRRYPPEAFAEALLALWSQAGIMPVFTGSAGEVEVVESVRARLTNVPSASLAGSLSLRDLVALIERAPLLISNNTGPVHVAAAVGTPVVDIYALTNPQHTPWQVPSRVLFHDVACRWCYASVCPEGHHDCVRLVEPRQVADAAVELLGLQGGTAVTAYP